MANNSVLPLMGVLLLGVIAVGGLAGVHTGAFVSDDIRSCVCVIHQMDYYGNIVSSQAQSILTQTNYPDDHVCDIRCSSYYGSSSHTHVVGMSMTSYKHEAK